MIVHDAAPTRLTPTASPGAPLPRGLPAVSEVRLLTLAADRPFELLVIPTADAATAAEQGLLVDIALEWALAGTPAKPVAPGLTPASVSMPLYGCHVIWTASRGGVLGPAGRLESLATAVAEFAACETDLRDLEIRGEAILATVEADAPAAFAGDDRSLGRQTELAARFREAVAVRHGLARIAATVHTPPVHPPTLANQVGERLRDRTRLIERHQLATERADFTLQIYEACGQRAADLTIARRQMGLEWVIIMILVAQLALMVVEMLSSGSST